MTISGRKSRTDWDRVNREYDSDAPIPYDANDPDDGPYDPNDDAAVEAFFKQATIWVGWPDQVLIQKDGVPCHPDGTPRLEAHSNQIDAAETGEVPAKAS
jgi:hypothetical protein